MEKTLAFIKPEAVCDNNSGKIINDIENAGFQISALKMVRLSVEQAQKFYEIHKEKAFFDDLVNNISCGSIIAMVLTKENAVEDFRKIMGAANPAAAEEGTLRKLYGESIEKNGIHGADSLENANTEIGFFFNKLEIID